MSIQRLLDFLIGVPLVWFLSHFKGSTRPSPQTPHKILVIKLAAVGDTILLIPILRAIKKAYPGASLDWLVSPINREIANTVPYVDHLMVWNRKPGWNLLQIVRLLRKEKYDVVIDFEQWARGTALITFLSGAPYSLGFNTPGQYKHYLFTSSAIKTVDRHELDEFFELARHLPGLQLDRRLELWETEKGRGELERFAPNLLQTKDAPYRILIHPGCGSDGLPREWPLVSYAVLGQWLMKKFGVELYLTSGPEETEKTNKLLLLMNRRAVDLGGKLSWSGMISLVQKMDMVVSGNTGVMHIAAALQKKQVALHGPTNPKLWGPLNEKAKVVQSPCPECPSLKLGFEYHRRDQQCMHLLDINEVKDAVDQLMSTMLHIDKK